MRGLPRMNASEMTHGWRCPVCRKITVQYLEPHFCRTCNRSQRHRLAYTEVTLTGWLRDDSAESSGWEHDFGRSRSRYWHQD